MGTTAVGAAGVTAAGYPPPPPSMTDVSDESPRPHSPGRTTTRRARRHNRRSVSARRGCGRWRCAASPPACRRICIRSRPAGAAWMTGLWPRSFECRSSLILGVGILCTRESAHSCLGACQLVTWTHACWLVVPPPCLSTLV